MFCRNCACELPAVAKFCIRCGSLVATPTSVSATQRLFCVNCGEPYDPSYKFCNYCGHPLPPVGGHADSSASDQPKPAQPIVGVGNVGTHAQVTPVMSKSPPRQESVPYATFVLRLLSSTLLISIATFATGEAVATNQWDITAWVGAPLLAAILTAWASKKTWSRIVSAEPETNINFKRRH